MDEPVIGFATTGKWNDKSLGELVEFPDINDKRDYKENTPYNNTNKRKRYYLGLFDCDELALKFNFINTDEGQAEFETDYANGTERNLEITFPSETGEKVVIPCLPVGMSLAVPKEEGMARTLYMKPNGKPDYTITESDGLTDPFFAMSGSGDLTPAAAGDEYYYTYIVANEVASVTVTPTASAGVIKVNGNVVASGAASSAIALAVGEYTDIEVEVKETGKAAVKYMIKAFREAA